MNTLTLKAEITKKSRQPGEGQLSQASTKPPSNTLQADFMDNLVGRTVTVYLINGIRLGGQIQQTDQYTLLLGGAEGSPDQLVFKHAISTIQPAEMGSSRRWPPGRLGRSRQPERSFGQPVRDFGNTDSES